MCYRSTRYLAMILGALLLVPGQARADTLPSFWVWVAGHATAWSNPNADAQAVAPIQPGTLLYVEDKGAPRWHILSLRYGQWAWLNPGDA